MHVTRTLEAQPDVWLYIKVVAIPEIEPVRCISWWPLGMRVEEFHALYGHEDIGKPVRVPIRAFPWRYETKHGIVVNLKDGQQTHTTYARAGSHPLPPVERQAKRPPNPMGRVLACLHPEGMARALAPSKRLPLFLDSSPTSRGRCQRCFL